MKYIYLLAILNLFSLHALAEEYSIILQLKETTKIAEVLTTTSLNYEKTLVSRLNIHLFSAPQKRIIDISKIKALPFVVDALWNTPIESRATYPNDPNYGSQWALEKLNLPATWDITTGGTSHNNDDIVIAIIDKDFSTIHEDLKSNTWINQDEIPDNNIDDDNNGYVDDISGWNFSDSTNSFSPGNHGTAISGVIGAEGNNAKGTTGINWNIDMLYLQYSNNPNVIADIFSAYDYITDLRERYNNSNGEEGAFIVALNASWGLIQLQVCEASSMWNQVHDMMGEVGILIAAAAKNKPINSDIEGDIPSACPSDYIISVASITESDAFWQQSAFGKETIDIAAPGDNILAPIGDTGYSTFQANSSATPHVAGTIALLYSLPCEKLIAAALNEPAQTALLIKEAILESVDETQELEELLVSGGRLNVFQSTSFVEKYCNSSDYGDEFRINKIYPNPVDKLLHLQYEVPNDATFDLFIYDMLGRLVKKRTVNPCCFKRNTEVLDVSTLAGGMYILELVRCDEMINLSQK